MNHTQYTRVYAPVDLDAIAFNMESMRKNIDQKTGMIGVIKTDAYGHGSVPVAEAIEDYVDGYAVATADEAVLLRRNDIKKMILILGVTHPSRYQELIEEEIRPAIFTMEPRKSIWRWIPECAALAWRPMKRERTLRRQLTVSRVLKSRDCLLIFQGPMRKKKLPL